MVIYNGQCHVLYKDINKKNHVFILSLYKNCSSIVSCLELCFTKYYFAFLNQCVLVSHKIRLCNNQ